MYMHMYMHMYICMCIGIGIGIDTGIGMRTYTCTFVCIHIYIYICRSTHVFCWGAETLDGWKSLRKSVSSTAHEQLTFIRGGALALDLWCWLTQAYVEFHSSPTNIMELHRTCASSA